jgi:hypothetical protein
VSTEPERPSRSEAERARDHAERARRRAEQRLARRRAAQAARRRIPLALALVATLVALLAGIVAGYAARDDDPPAGLMTVEREVVVVTVTAPVTEAPAESPEP